MSRRRPGPGQLLLDLSDDRRRCAICSTLLSGQQQLYCGARCRRRSERSNRAAWQRDNWHRYQMERQCERCSQTYRVRYDRKGQRFCSRGCAVRARPGGSAVGLLRHALEAGDDALALDILLQRTVSDGSCLRWTGQFKGRYPDVAVAKRNVRAHRLVLELTLGRTLTADEPAHHRCGNPWCVRPEHLQLVTHAENTAEMLARRAYLARIEALERALAEAEPNHVLLTSAGACQAPEGVAGEGVAALAHRGGAGVVCGYGSGNPMAAQR